jgi:hypothetical protein
MFKEPAYGYRPGFKTFQSFAFAFAIAHCSSTKGVLRYYHVLDAGPKLR